MNHLTNPKLKHFAQELRKNMTKEERKLWYQFLRGLPIQFRRQMVVGDYILDFYCGSKKIAIELDGSQHFEEEGQLRDQKRDAFLYQKGITVLRYSNADVNSRFEGVCEDILQHLET